MRNTSCTSTTLLSQTLVVVDRKRTRR